jgi:polar amino acid transport system permease protein
VSDWTPSQHEVERRQLRRRLRTRSVLIATAMMVVVFVGIGVAVTSSPGWETFKAYFFDWSYAKDSFPSIWKGFWINVQLFLIAEPLILVVGLAVALARSARSPWLVPVRILAVVYTDLLRGIPTILLIVLLGFGMPSLQLQGLPDSRFFWSAVGLVLSYGAYVAEVFRSGMESIHPSQVASAEALGLSRGQTMRHVVVPQAVRRVIPPLLNDFVSLQKDTALVLAVGLFDAVFAAKDYANFNFNYTPMVVVAGFFVAITIPLARLCDWLQHRMVEKERAGAR